MIRAVVDANVIAGGAVRFRTRQTAPSRVVRAWLGRQFEMIVSDHVERETDRTLSLPYFRERIDSRDRRLISAALVRRATRVELRDSVTGVASHPHDDPVLETALLGGADYLVTGDKALRRLKTFRGVAIVDPTTFLAILEAERGG